MFQAAQCGDVPADPRGDEPSSAEVVPVEVVPIEVVERERVREIVAGLEEAHTLIAVWEARKVALLAQAEAVAAAQTSRIASARSRDREFPYRSLAAELGCATRVNDRSMQAHLGRARELADRFPATLAALSSGAIANAHVNVILDTGSPIDDDAARAEFEEAVLARARRDTPGRTRAFARALAERLNPRGMPERHAAAREDRCVFVTDLPDGMASLTAIAPALEVHGIFDRITAQAKAIRDVADANDGAVVDGDVIHDARTVAQIRTDVLVDMLLTGAPSIDPTADTRPGGLGAIRATVHVTVPATTLAGTTTSGAELANGCPADPATVRCLAGDAPGWDRVFLHPVTGIVEAVDRYRPSDAQRRFLQARDRHCRFPGCRVPARRCDVDHTHDAALGGKTAVCNLACFCKRHHTLKHETEWTVRQLRGGRLEWTSPTGRTHIDDPPPRVVFAPDTDPPPF